MFSLFKKKPLPSRIILDIGLATHTGKKRKLNEDSLICIDLSQQDRSVRACAVADGLGGYEGGEIASKSALEAFSKSLTESINAPGGKPIHDKNYVMSMMLKAVQAANTEVYNQAQSRMNRMATTIAAVLILNMQAYIVNVGDSRVYYLDGDDLRRITADHSLVAELVASGKITPDEVYTHPQRNMITRCLGSQSDVEADAFLKDLKPGSAFLVCSDGLWEMVRDNQIKDILLQSSNAQAACDQLVAAANNNGGMDNISAILIKAK